MPFNATVRCPEGLPRAIELDQKGAEFLAARGDPVLGLLNTSPHPC